MEEKNKAEDSKSMIWPEGEWQSQWRWRIKEWNLVRGRAEEMSDSVWDMEGLRYFLNIQVWPQKKISAGAIAEKQAGDWNHGE